VGFRGQVFHCLEREGVMADDQFDATLERFGDGGRRDGQTGHQPLDRPAWVADQ
jgi:hypothetical protein